MFQTDLNHRERAELVKSVDAMSASLGRMKVSLETAEDDKMMIELIIASFTWDAIFKRLKPVIDDAVKVADARKDLERFDGFPG